MTQRGVTKPTDDRRRLLLSFGVVVAVVILDQLTKEWARRRLSGNRTIGLLPTLEFDLTTNSGFSFSTGSGAGRFVGVVVIVVSGVIAWQIWRSADFVRALILAGLLGGALGNLWDRVFRADDGLLSGEVIDFIDVSWYAVFNVADIFVVGSALGLIAYEVIVRPRRYGRERS